MRTYGSGVRHERSLARVFEDGILIFAQDASEYAFIGLLGAAVACIGTLVLASIGGAIAVALIPPFVAVVAVATMATATEGLRRITNNLQPESAQAFAAVLRRASTLVAPWAPFALALGAALFVRVAFSHHVPPLPRKLIELVALCVVAAYALGRSYVVPAMVVERANPHNAAAGSAELVRAAPGKPAIAWGICLSPAILVGLLALSAGFGPVSAAVLAFAFVGALPFAAVVMSLLFFDAVMRSARSGAGARRIKPITSTAGRRALH